MCMCIYCVYVQYMNTYIYSYMYIQTGIRGRAVADRRPDGVHISEFFSGRVVLPMYMHRYMHVYI